MRWMVRAEGLEPPRTRFVVNTALPYHGCVAKRSWTDDQLREAAAHNTSILGVLRDLNLRPTSGNYETIKRYTNVLRLDTTHWLGQRSALGKPSPARVPLAEILVENSRYTYSPKVKARLLAEGLLQNECALCGISEWRGRPLVLHLDHRNGVPTDQRLENLRLLCPNCDSQTDTYCGRNKRR